jgi:hypothetical protein
VNKQDMKVWWMKIYGRYQLEIHRQFKDICYQISCVFH